MNDEPRTTDDARPGPGHGRAVVLFSLVALMAYFNSLHGAYILDDYRFSNDPNIGRPFESDMAPRPFIALSLAINYWVDGLNPRGYHAMNLFAHILAGLLVYDLVRRTLLVPRFAGRFDRAAGWIGLVAGLAWMVHPLNTQSVTYVIQRCESFMGLFLLASLWCYLRGVDSPRGWAWNLAAVVLCGFGAACKEMMIVLAPLALLYDRTFLTGSWRETLRARWLPLGLLAVPPVAGIAALAVNGFFTDTTGTVGFGVKNYTPYTYALTQTEVILHYLKLSFVPVGLTLDYLDWRPCTSIAESWASVAAIAAIVLATTCGVLLRAAWSFPAAWFLVCLAPTSTFVPVQDAAFEHRMYLPLIGVVALVVCGIASLACCVRPRNLAILGGTGVFLLAMLTASRNEDYATGTRLTQDNVEKRPMNSRARLNYAVQLFSDGDVRGAEEQLNEAANLPLRLPSVRGEYVKVLRELGRTGEAVKLSEDMVRENPESPDAKYELGLSLLTDGRAAEALPYLQKTAEAKPSNPFIRLHHAIALQRTGSSERAAGEFRATHDLDPKYAERLSQAARRVANDPEAKPAILRLTAWYANAATRMKDPPTPEMLDTLALGLARQGEFEEAAKVATRAAERARAAGEMYLADRYAAHAALFRNRKTHLPETREAKP